jgi:hypothetical protein
MPLAPVAVKPWSRLTQRKSRRSEQAGLTHQEAADALDYFREKSFLTLSGVRLRTGSGTLSVSVPQKSGAARRLRDFVHHRPPGLTEHSDEQEPASMAGGQLIIAYPAHSGSMKLRQMCDMPAKCTVGNGRYQTGIRLECLRQYDQRTATGVARANGASVCIHASAPSLGTKQLAFMARDQLALPPTAPG